MFMWFPGPMINCGAAHLRGPDGDNYDRDNDEDESDDDNGDDGDDVGGDFCFILRQRW